MGVLVLAGCYIGLLLLFFYTALFYAAHFHWVDFYSRSCLVFGTTSCECERFSAGARACQGGSMNWDFERQLNVLRSIRKSTRILTKRLRKPTITGSRMSSGLEYRSETSGFHTVLAALLRDVPLNLFFSRARHLRLNSIHNDSFASSSFYSLLADKKGGFKLLLPF